MLFDTGWAIYTLAYVLGSSFVVVICESQKLKKIGAIAEGLGDFVLRRFGPRGNSCGDRRLVLRLALASFED